MNRSYKGKLFVLSGPSGAGKGTLRKKVFETVEDIRFSISCTTRPPRQGEKDGVDYRFISEEAFLTLLEEDRFLEYAKVHGHYYGTLRDDVERTLSSGIDMVLEIDVQGAFQVREKMPESILVFVSPPSLEELERRLRERGTESGENLRIRLRNARLEMLKSGDYDYVIVNDDAERASNELKSIITGFRPFREERK
ncbi:MAG TPA: guanylate kinase [Aminivibrio sp.]|jgi:guanylate kinase|uniref:guanylate kinase n=1 Tax=Aminivibrio sp. TaxID=1872489 RepID=UPI002C1EC8BB|nr:guanylate kinase [Aminivibrio sp.]MDD3514963.1 guanylate kinase [Synergistaceae bacterium]NCB15414.1 guanylate kinase [Synergistales bacterium]HPF85513.1 guanylate kinase [Aminivibrio sp.]HPK06270.1 guanylate kinase [Aminivibrio sp.]HRX25873.1 guanylate kinase [Aminivibrio sp.]